MDTMDRSRNIDFDATVEIHSLKDAVWRLTTRVYLLEDFIAEKFGEVLSPSGFTTNFPTSPVPSPSEISSSKSKDGVEISISSSRTRNSPKRAGPAENPAGYRRIISSSSKNEIVGHGGKKLGEGHSVNNPDMECQSQDVLLIPKDEIVQKHFDDEDLEGNDDFLNDKSDEDDDSGQNDPDFIPSASTKTDNKEQGSSSSEKEPLKRKQKVQETSKGTIITPGSGTIPQKRIKRDNRSPVYLHFTEIEGGQVQCNYCRVIYQRYGGGSTSSYLKHLKSKHSEIPLLPEGGNDNDVT